MFAIAFTMLFIFYLRGWFKWAKGYQQTKGGFDDHDEHGILSATPTFAQAAFNIGILEVLCS